MNLFAPFLATFLLLAVPAMAELPKGWWAAKTDQYELGLDRQTRRDGKPSAFIASIVPEPSNFIGLNQTFRADDFRGKRVRLKGFLKTHDVKKWAGFWLRADDAKNQIVAFDNMQKRGLSGTSDWQAGEIVLDIPATAEVLYLGLLLDGSGKVWMNDLSFEVVDASVPTTTPQKLPSRPVNLDFTEQASLPDRSPDTRAPQPPK